MEFFLLVRSNEISISVSFSFFFFNGSVDGIDYRLSGGESRELSWNSIISKIVLFFFPLGTFGLKEEREEKRKSKASLPFSRTSKNSDFDHAILTHLPTLRA